MKKKRIRIITDSIKRFINGTDETRSGVVEMHVGLSPEDADAVKSGEAELVAAIVENGESIIDVVHTPPTGTITDVGSGRGAGRSGHSGGLSHVGGTTHVSTHTPDDGVVPDSDGSHMGGYSPDTDDSHVGGHLPDTDDTHIGSTHGDNESENDEKDDDDERTTILGIPLFKKLAGIGTAIGLALLLSQCQGVELGNPFIDVHEEHHIEQSDYRSVAEVTDMYFSSDEYLRGSQVRSPGEMIDEMRNASWSEELGREEGREEYDARGGAARSQDERKIQEINRQFNEQTQIIQESRAVIEDPSSTPEEVEEAIKAIADAKHRQGEIYQENIDLFGQYHDRAVEDVSSPSDDRTEDEVSEYDGVEQQYRDGLENLLRDEEKLRELIDMYLDPEQYEEVFFSESAEERFDAQDKGGIINTAEAFGPSGHREVVDSEVTTSLGVNPNDAGQVHEGLVNASQVREVTVRETRYGISAIFHKIGDFFTTLGQKIFSHKEESADLQAQQGDTSQSSEKSSNGEEGR